VDSSDQPVPASQAQVKWADYAAIGAFVISIVTACFSWGTLKTDREALHANSQAAVDAERTTLFLQFEEQYYSIAGRFPKQLHEPQFRPAPRSDDYARLQAYWFFCFSEWYATQRANRSAFGDLWTKYYEPLIATGLKIPSLRYVLEDGIRRNGVGGGDWTAFLRELAGIANAHGYPLDQDVQRKINGDDTAEIRITDVSLTAARVHRKS
jgi:hypothetical protein